jgi:hypothetical protein
MFIEASQHVFAKIYSLFISLLCHLANVIAYLLEGFFNILVHVFDIYIIIPVQVYNMFKGKPISVS